MPDATMTPHSSLVPLDHAEGLEPLLDQLVEMAWEPGWAPLVLSRLIALCAALRSPAAPQPWAESLARLRAHPLQRLMLEDPLVRESLLRPGPTPAPIALDLLIQHESVRPLLDHASRAGHDLATATRQIGYAAAWRAQARFLARIVDAVAEREAQAEILTLGAGHLREAGFVSYGRNIARWVMQENDPEALALLRRQAPAGLALRSLRCGLPYFVRRPYLRGCFDLIMVPDLPLLPEPARLVDAAFAALKPGGVLLLGSPTAAPPEAAFLEAYLGLTPAWRPAEALAALAHVPPAAEMARAQVIPSLEGRRHYLRLERRR
ncbi:hypothetical protein NON00_19320 [Roseomonas sp. GC11]|uniref:hypothetical protein n=1 Tax=Roseomonas sp. GC11 TaxID=2950546 RepID=UPI00210B3AE6|nr:hypothetical protein [Roseomonas sp. GC11]MCQ4162068.1 hypothetical protein [Roseomonas sp. GC11]